MDKKVYIIHGTTGEYSDYSEWSVKAFVDKDKAEDFKNKCQERADAWNKINGSRYIPCDKVPQEYLTHDPNLAMYYDPVVYCIIEVPFEDQI